MTEANIAVARQAVDALNRHDVDGYLAMCTPDIQLFTPIAPLEGPSEGEAGVRAYFAAIAEGAREFRVELERFEAVGKDRVLGVGRLNIVSQTGVPMGRPIANIYDLAGGKLRRVRIFFDADEARAAAASAD